jgi:AcrR family transcriptional regulator
MAVTTTAPSLGAKGTRTRSALLEQAIRRFAMDGYRRTSVSDIARAAGLTPAAAYAYFGGKEEIFEAAVDADAAGLIEEAMPQMVESAVSANWPRVVEALLEALVRHPLAKRILSGQEPEHIQRLIDIPALTGVRDAIVVQLEHGQQVGRIRRDIDLRLIARGLTTVVMALLIAMLQTGVQPVGEVAAGVSALLDAALVVRPV